MIAQNPTFGVFRQYLTVTILVLASKLARRTLGVQGRTGTSKL